MKKFFKILFFISIFSVTATPVCSCMLTETKNTLTKEDLLKCDPYIIIANRDVNGQDEKGQTVLHHAAIEGHAGFIAQLLERDADPQICDYKGMIPLFYAIIGEHYDCVKELTSGENYANIMGPNYTTALHLAALRGYAAAVKILIERGADVNARDGNGQTPLFYAKSGRLQASTGSHSKNTGLHDICLQILLAYGATK